MERSIHIEINKLSKSYHGSNAKALDTVSFAIKGQSKVGVFGPNGAGKTTLISLITNIIEADSGKVRFSDGKATINSQQIKKRLGYVPQDFAFYEELTMFQNLEFFGAMFDLRGASLKDKSLALIKSLGLENHQEKKVKSFSGGMKRRLNLAIALIHEPDLLVLDEPIVGIDVQSKNAILKFLGDLNQNGTTIIYTSHHLLEAQQFCDYFVFLDYGKLIAKGELQDLLIEHHCQDLKELFLKLTGEEYRD